LDKKLSVQNFKNSMIRLKMDFRD